MRNHQSHNTDTLSARRFHVRRSISLIIVQTGLYLTAAATCGLALSSHYRVDSLAFSSDGHLLVGAVNGYMWPRWNNFRFMYGVIKLWDAGIGKPVAELAGPGTSIEALAVSPSDSTIAVAGDSPSIEVWDPAQGTRKGVITGHRGDIFQLAFSPSGALLASTDNDGEVRLWDMPTGRARLTLKGDEYGDFHLEFSPNEQLLAAEGLNGIRFWDKNDGHLVNQIEKRRELSDRVRSRLGFLGFTGSEQGFLLTRREGHHGEAAAVLDGSTQVERFACDNFPRLMKLSPDGRELAVGDLTAAVLILDTTSGHTRHRLEGLKDRILCFAFSPDGTHIAAADNKSRICVWDTRTGEQQTCFSCNDPLNRWWPTAIAILVLVLTTITIRK